MLLQWSLSGIQFYGSVIATFRHTRFSPEPTAIAQLQLMRPRTAHPNSITDCVAHIGLSILENWCDGALECCVRNLSTPTTPLLQHSILSYMQFFFTHSTISQRLANQRSGNVLAYLMQSSYILPVAGNAIWQCIARVSILGSVADSSYS